MAASDLIMLGIGSPGGIGAFITLGVAVDDGEVHQYVSKGADLGRASTTTLADDPDLGFVGVANASYALTAGLLVNAPAAADLLLQMSGPSGAAADVVIYGPTDSVGSFSETASATYTGSAGADVAIGLTGVVVVGGTQGRVALQWAQAVSDASPTTLKAGSWLSYRPIT